MRAIARTRVRNIFISLMGPLLGLFCVLAILFTGFVKPAHAVTSDVLNFQARLLNAQGAVVADGNYNVEFKIYTASSGGSAVWTETRTSGNRVRVVDGYLTANL